jgi:hypothetical protein
MSNAVVPFGEMESMATYIVRSKLFGAKDEPQAMSLMLLAQAEGMHPMSAVQDYDVVQGRPARKTHSILARFQQAGGCVAWEEVSGTRACGVFSHKQGGSLRVEWTFEQAKKIGLTGKDNWKNYPQAMLRARCIAEGVRAVFPGAIGGMMSVEEAQDIVQMPAKNMGSVVSATQQLEYANPEPIIAEVDACVTVDDLKRLWADKNGLFVGQPDDHARFKAACTERRIAIESALDEAL